MKSLLIIIVLLLMLQSCFTVQSNEHFIYRKLTVNEYYKALHDSSNYYLIDVRTPPEYHKSHARGAVNYNFLAFHYGRDVDSLNRNSTAFIYCHTCHRSPFAARKMKHKGFKCVYDLKGGFSQWLKGNLPVDTGATL